MCRNIGSRLDKVPAEVRQFWRRLPKFSDGRIDYTQARAAAVLDCYVFCQDRLLVLKRTREIDGVQNQWHVVSGYLDERVSLREKTLAELAEETGISSQDVLAMRPLCPYSQSAEKQWIVYPITAIVQQDIVIRLNEEHSAFRWIARSEAKRYLLPQVGAAIDRNPIAK